MSARPDHRGKMTVEAGIQRVLIGWALLVYAALMVLLGIVAAWWAPLAVTFVLSGAVSAGVAAGIWVTKA